MPLCSIIIPVYNQAGLTRQCLDALLRTVGSEEDVEIIVVDDASRDATPAVIAHYGGRVRGVCHEKNQGFAFACNDGGAAAHGDFLVFLNNDTIPLPGWLDALLDYAAAHPAAGVIGSKLLFPNDTIQHAGMVIAGNRQPRHIYFQFPTDHPAVNKSRQFQIVTGACMLMSRQAFLATNGFDTTFLNGYEDVDLCLRLGELGYQVHYCHTSVLYHLEGMSEGRDRHESLNAQYYHRRWDDKVRPDEWIYYFEDGLIEVDPMPGCLEIKVAPELGACRLKGDFAKAADLLLWRAGQVRRLLRENVLLRNRHSNQEESSSRGLLADKRV